MLPQISTIMLPISAVEVFFPLEIYHLMLHVVECLPSLWLHSHRLGPSKATLHGQMTQPVLTWIICSHLLASLKSLSGIILCHLPSFPQLTLACSRLNSTLTPVLTTVTWRLPREALCSPRRWWRWLTMRRGKQMQKREESKCYMDG